MSQGSSTHSRHTDFDEMGMHQTNNGHVLSWVPFFYWCQKHDFCCHFRNSYGEQRGPCSWLPFTMCLTQRKAESPYSDASRLTHPTAHVNVQSWD